jgi:hypothetical protein
VRRIRQHAAYAGEDLSEGGSVTSAVMVFVNANRFQLDQPQYRGDAPAPTHRRLPRAYDIRCRSDCFAWW